MEELIAELGSAFLCAHCRLDGVLEHASYLNAWLDLLRADQRAIFLAAGKAQSACDYLLGKSGLLSEPETALTA
jgi:antirestriction protein ArdC